MLKSLALCAALLLTAAPVFAQEAPQSVAGAADDDGVPQAVRDACQKDYDKFCSQHGHNKDAVRDCMAHAFDKLSDPCVTAILDSPLADQPASADAAAPTQDSVETAAVNDDTKASATKKPGAASPHQASAHHHTRIAQSEPAARQAKSLSVKRPSARIAHREPNKLAKSAAKPRTQTANSHRWGGTPKRSVASYVQHGTGIANYYVAKYTRFALAKAFH